MNSAEYVMDEDMLGILGGLGIFGISMAFILVIFGIIAVCSVISYVLYRIPLYKMAKKAGMPHAGLIWIPYCIELGEVMLPEGEFELFKGFLHAKKRTTPFIIYLVITLGGGLVASILSFMSSLTFGLTGILAALVAPVFGIGAKLYKWRFDYDFFNCFAPADRSTNMVLSILAIFVPLARLIYFYVLMNREPVYGAGRYEEAHRA